MGACEFFQYFGVEVFDPWIRVVVFVCGVFDVCVGPPEVTVFACEVVEDFFGVFVTHFLNIQSGSLPRSRA